MVNWFYLFEMQRNNNKYDANKVDS